MYRPSTYPSSYLFSYLSTYIWDLIFLPIYLYMRAIFPTYLPIYETYFPTYLPIYETYFPTELVTKVKPKINSLVIHTHTHTHTQNVQSFEQKWSVSGPGSKMPKPKRVLCLVSMDQICGWRRRVPTRMEYKKDYWLLHLQHLWTWQRQFNWSSLTICNFNLNLPQGLCLDFFA
jgi:hypothetical protein